MERVSTKQKWETVLHDEKCKKRQKAEGLLFAKEKTELCCFSCILLVCFFSFGFVGDVIFSGGEERKHLKKPNLKKEGKGE